MPDEAKRRTAACSNRVRKDSETWMTKITVEISIVMQDIEVFESLQSDSNQFVMWNEEIN
jgi:polyhydroxyalkanoate synthesis regulator phasin